MTRWVCLFLLLGCGNQVEPIDASTPSDALPMNDAEIDGGTEADGGEEDAGEEDAGEEDANAPEDSGFPDADLPDAGDPPLTGLFVDPVNGDDANSGTLEMPFRNIFRAADLAMDGDTIYLLDGTHEIQFIQVRDGVNIRALNPGMARVQLMPFTNGAFVLQGDTQVHGLHINSAGAFGFFQISSGTLVMEETHYTAPNGLYSFVSAGGTADVRLVAPSDGEWCLTECSTPFADGYGTATIRIEGGRIANFTNVGSLLQTNGSARLYVSDVVIEDGSGSNIVTLGNSGINTNTSTVVLERVTIRNTTATALRVGFGPSHLEVIDSTIIDNGGVGLEIDSGGNYSPLPHMIRIDGSRFENNLIGIRFFLYARTPLMLTDTVITGNTQDGIEGRFSAEGTWIDMAGGELTNNGGHGINLTNEFNKLNMIRLRGVTLSGNVNHGLHLTGLPGSTFDLGTDVDPGMNTIRDNGATFTGVSVNVDPGDIVWAVGNTWIPNAQGADAGGNYVPASGTYTEVTGPVAAGENYRISNAARIRF